MLCRGWVCSSRESGFNLNSQTYNGTLPLEEHQETISRISNYFKKAGKSNVPEGWEALVDLHLAIYKKTENSEDRVTAFEGLKKAGQLGSTQSYTDFYRHFKDQFSAFIQAYGAPLQSDLWKDLKTFIEEVNP